MDETTNILEKHWKWMSMKYHRTGDTIRWEKTLRSVRCALCGESSRERKLDQAFQEWGLLLFHASKEGRMPEVCPECMKKISPRQIHAPRMAICAGGCGATQREKIFGIGFPGWQTIRFPAQAMMPPPVKIMDLWCPNCSIKLARKLGPEFVRGSWTDQSALFTSNSLLLSTQMQNLYINVTEAAYPHDNLLRGGNFESWGAGAAAVPEGWTLPAGAVAREAATVRIGTYALRVDSGAANARVQQLIGGFTFADYGPRPFTFGCWVYASTAAEVSILLGNQGSATSTSVFHSGTAGWEWLTVTHTLDGGATGLYVECINNNGTNHAYFDGATLVESEHVEAFTEHANQAIFDEDTPPIKNFLYKDAVVKGWIQFRGNGGGILERDSFNVSSIVDDGVGAYTVNWDTDFANDDYACAGNSTGGNNIITFGTYLVGSVAVRNYNTGTSTNLDSAIITVIAIGNQ